MATILEFRKKTPSQRHKGKGLCRSGFHKWKVVGETRFDVRRGRLVTVCRCQRCGKTRNTMQ